MTQRYIFSKGVLLSDEYIDKLLEECNIYQDDSITSTRLKILQLNEVDNINNIYEDFEIKETKNCYRWLDDNILILDVQIDNNDVLDGIKLYTKELFNDIILNKNNIDTIEFIYIDNTDNDSNIILVYLIKINIHIFNIITYGSINDIPKKYKHFKIQYLYTKLEYYIK